MAHLPKDAAAGAAQPPLVDLTVVLISPPSLPQFKPVHLKSLSLGERVRDVVKNKIFITLEHDQAENATSIFDPYSTQLTCNGRTLSRAQTLQESGVDATSTLAAVLSDTVALQVRCVDAAGAVFASAALHCAFFGGGKTYAEIKARRLAAFKAWTVKRLEQEICAQLQNPSPGKCSAMRSVASAPELARLLKGPLSLSLLPHREFPQGWAFPLLPAKVRASPQNYGEAWPDYFTLEGLGLLTTRLSANGGGAEPWRKEVVCIIQARTARVKTSLIPSLGESSFRAAGLIPAAAACIQAGRSLRGVKLKGRHPAKDDGSDDSDASSESDGGTGSQQSPRPNLLLPWCKTDGLKPAHLRVAVFVVGAAFAAQSATHLGSALMWRIAGFVGIERRCTHAEWRQRATEANILHHLDYDCRGCNSTYRVWFAKTTRVVDLKLAATRAHRHLANLWLEQQPRAVDQRWPRCLAQHRDELQRGTVELPPPMLREVVGAHVDVGAQRANKLPHYLQGSSYLKFYRGPYVREKWDDHYQMSFWWGECEQKRSESGTFSMLMLG